MSGRQQHPQQQKHVGTQGHGSGGGGARPNTEGSAADSAIGLPTANKPAHRLTRSIVAKCLAREEITGLPRIVNRHWNAVRLLRQALKLEDCDESLQRCWAALDSFLVGHSDIDPPAKPFNRHLRTVNFCIDLYNDYCRGVLPLEDYIAARGKLMNPDHLDRITVGRFRIQTNGFRTTDVVIQQPGAAVVTVRAEASLDPQRVYAMKRDSIDTCLGHLSKAEIVVPDAQDPQTFRVTGRNVVLKYFDKNKLDEVSSIREDPFKEIAALNFLGKLPQFPEILDVLEDDHTIIKVEENCGISLFDVCNAAPDRRIPENWVVMMLRQLVEGIHVLHSAGFVHLDLSVENTMFHSTTRKIFIIDFGFLARIPREAESGRMLPFAAGMLKPTGKVMACAPELYRHPAQALDATKVDIFALGSIVFSLATKDFAFHIARPNDPGFARFLAGTGGAYLAEKVAHNFGSHERTSRELQNIVSAAMHPDPAQRCTIVELARLILAHQRKYPPPGSV